MGQVRIRSSGMGSRYGVPWRVGWCHCAVLSNDVTLLVGVDYETSLGQARFSEASGRSLGARSGRVTAWVAQEVSPQCQRSGSREPAIAVGEGFKPQPLPFQAPYRTSLDHPFHIDRVLSRYPQNSALRRGAAPAFGFPCISAIASSHSRSHPAGQPIQRSQLVSACTQTTSPSTANPLVGLIQVL